MKTMGSCFQQEENFEKDMFVRKVFSRPKELFFKLYRQATFWSVFMNISTENGFVS